MERTRKLAETLGFANLYELEALMKDPKHVQMVCELNVMITHYQTVSSFDIQRKATATFNKYGFNVQEYGMWARKRWVEYKEQKKEFENIKRKRVDSGFGKEPLKFTPAFCQNCNNKDLEIKKLKKEIYDLKEENADLSCQLALLEHEFMEKKKGMMSLLE